MRLYLYTTIVVVYKHRLFHMYHFTPMLTLFLPRFYPTFLRCRGVWYLFPRTTLLGVGGVWFGPISIGQPISPVYRLRPRAPHKHQTSNPTYPRINVGPSHFDFKITFVTDAETQDFLTAVRPFKRGLPDVKISSTVQLWFQRNLITELLQATPSNILNAGMWQIVTCGLESARIAWHTHVPSSRYFRVLWHRYWLSALIQGLLLTSW